MTQEELFEHMREWNAFVRRHNANIFDVMFKDVDYSLKDDDLYSIISGIALFFGLDIPNIKTHCDTLARIELDSNNENCSELYYNWQLLQKSGINNRDAFTLCMVHELTHLYFKDTRFLLCRNERWCHELAADYVVGVYSALKGIATGKYKYVVRQLPMTPTHPKGEHRADAVKFARECMLRFPWHDVNSAMAGLPAFVYGRQKLLNEELVQCARDIKEKKDVILQSEPIAIEDLSDNNLIKQAVLKYKNSK